MLRWTIFGMVVIFPRVVSSTLETFGAFTLTPLSPRSRLKYRFLIESRAWKIASFRLFSISSSIFFASSRSRSRALTRAAVAAFLRSSSSICSVYSRPADWAIWPPPMVWEPRRGARPVRAPPRVERAREDPGPQGVHDRRDEEGDLDVIHDLGQVLRERALDRARRAREG